MPPTRTFHPDGGRVVLAGPVERAVPSAYLATRGAIAEHELEQVRADLRETRRALVEITLRNIRLMQMCQRLQERAELAENEAAALSQRLELEDQDTVVVGLRPEGGSR